MKYEILILGEPASGKSNFLRMLAYKWTLADSAVKQTKTPSENENKQSAITKSIGKWFWLFVIPLVIGIILIAIQFKWFK